MSSDNDATDLSPDCSDSSASPVDLDLDPLDPSSILTLHGGPAPPGDCVDSVDEGPRYADADYWEERYEAFPLPFDWYQTWAELQPLIGHFFNGTEKVLNVGCGTSPMSVDIAPFFSSVVNIDISSVAIRQMRAAYAEHANVSWFVMDCTQMIFPDGLFDVAFDKGTLDALFCGAEAAHKVALTLSEVYRVLRPGGLFFEITFGVPGSRSRLFEQIELDWELLEPASLRNEEKDTEHWIYVFRKAAPRVRVEEVEAGA
jgi:ubiquinone/menaquinone biosynthesis C-methylase UbiE